MNMLEPKEIEVNGKKYIIHKMSATTGRRVMALYFSSLIPGVGSYETNHDMMLTLMQHVGVKINDQTIMLATQDLVDNHVQGWDKLVELEARIMDYNFDFLHDGRILKILEDLAQKSTSWATKMLTKLSELLLAPTEPH